MRKHVLIRKGGFAALISVGIVVILGAMVPFLGWAALWATPDQRGKWLLAQGANERAADQFVDPVWRGVALMRAGKFREAADSFAQSASAEANYDRGNALVMLGDYPDAIALYKMALSLRPNWPDAKANFRLAKLRADQFTNLQGEEADEDHAPTDEAYNSNRKRDPQEQTDPKPQGGMSNQAVRSLWLLRVQTKPSDFLRARFSYQSQHETPDAAP